MTCAKYPAGARGFTCFGIETVARGVLESRASAGPLLQTNGAMQLRSKNSFFVWWLWWRSVFLLALGSLVIAAVFGWVGAVSFAAGGLAFQLGSLMSGLFALRADAPSGGAAALAVMLGMALKWVVVAALLIGAMLAPAAQPTWVLVGLVFAQVVFVLAAMTFKRR